MIDLWRDHDNVRGVKAMMRLAQMRRRAGRSPDPFYRAAGQLLVRLRRGRSFAEWEALVKTDCGISSSRASELVQIAGGKSPSRVRFEAKTRAKKSRRINATDMSRSKLV
jgi:hypothetical protein